jgi:hypothetical protein
MKTVFVYSLSVLALALPLGCILLLPCEEDQDNQSFLAPNITSNSSFPSDSSSSPPFCSPFPSSIWASFESLFVPGMALSNPICLLRIQIAHVILFYLWAVLLLTSSRHPTSRPSCPRSCDHLCRHICLQFCSHASLPFQSAFCVQKSAFQGTITSYPSFLFRLQRLARFAVLLSSHALL